MAQKANKYRHLCCVCAGAIWEFNCDIYISDVKRWITPSAHFLLLPNLYTRWPCVKHNLQLNDTFAVQTAAKLHQQRLCCDMPLSRSVQLNCTIQRQSNCIHMRAICFAFADPFFPLWDCKQLWHVWVDKQSADVISVWSTTSSLSSGKLGAKLLQKQWWMWTGCWTRNDFMLAGLWFALLYLLHVVQL